MSKRTQLPAENWWLASALLLVSIAWTAYRLIQFVRK